MVKGWCAATAGLDPPRLPLPDLQPEPSGFLGPDAGQFGSPCLALIKLSIDLAIPHGLGRFEGMRRMALLT